MNNQEAIKELAYIKIKLKEANVFINPSMDIAINMATELLEQEPNPFCALAGRECPFQGKEYAWCLTCPHISEEDRALVKKVASEPKRGKWINYTDEGFVECPFCHSATNCEGNIDELKYCFSCGARLESDEE